MKKIVLIIFLHLTYSMSAQDITCSTVLTDPDAYHAELKRIAHAKKIQINKQAKATSGAMRYIAINPIIFTKNDGSGGLTYQRMNVCLQNLNTSFKPINIEFYFSVAEADIVYIKDDNFMDGTYTSAEELEYHNMYSVANAINIFFIGKTRTGASGYVAQLRPQSQERNRLVIANGYVTGKVISHEMGHYFHLIHTFENAGSSVIDRRELVTRLDVETDGRLPANCGSTGDYLCDTPADPRGRTDGSTTVSGCVYSGSVVDANGDLFDPLVRNFMDYNFCSNPTFTNGQYARMNDAYDYFHRADAPFNFTAPPISQNAPQNITAIPVNQSVNKGVTISWTDASTVETGYFIERASNPNGPYAPLTSVAPNETSYTDDTVENGVTYYYTIRPSNNPNVSAVSNAVTAPNLCAMGTTYACKELFSIQQFFLYDTDGSTRLIERSVTECSEDNYGDFYNSHSATLKAGQSYSFKEKSPYINGSQRLYHNVFIDYNDDGDFDDENETVYKGMSKEYNITRSFSVPSNVSNAEVRMRVVISDNNLEDACSTINRGEYEDYKIVLFNETLATDTNVLPSDFTLYPNPNSGHKIYLKGNSAQLVQSVKVYAINGQAIHVLLNKMQDGVEIATPSKLSSGVYIVSIITNNQTIQKKLIVK